MTRSIKLALHEGVLNITDRQTVHSQCKQKSKLHNTWDHNSVVKTQGFCCVNIS